MPAFPASSGATATTAACTRRLTAARRGRRCWPDRTRPPGAEHPVDAFDPASIFDHVLPPSVVLYTPRSLLSLQSLPGTQAYTVFVFTGSIRIFAMRSESLRPMLTQVSPPSVVL